MSVVPYKDKWRAIVRRTGHTTKTKVHKNKWDAEAWAAAQETKIGVSGNRVDPDKALVVTLFERYATEVAPGMRGRNTVNTIKRLIRDCAFMNVPIQDLAPHHIRDWRDARVKEVQKQSVTREFNDISGVLTHAIKEWGVEMVPHPARQVSRYPSPPSRKKRWTAEKIAKILKACNWREDMALNQGRDYVGWAFLLAIETAMREAEICLPLVSDFYPDEKRIHLCKSKNGDARDVPLNKRAMEIVARLCRDKKPNEKIVPMIGGTLSEYFADVRDVAGLKGDMVFHDTRHEGTTRLAGKFSNVLQLAAVTGHRNLNSLRVYYNPTTLELAAQMD